MKQLLHLIFYSLVMFCFVHCHSTKKFFSKVHIALGAEVLTTTFYSKQSGLLPGIRGNLLNHSGQTDRKVFNIDGSPVTSGFLTVSSTPYVLPQAEKYWILRFLSFSISVRSPRITRGALQNYPDTGISTVTPFETLVLESAEFRAPFGRFTDFFFEEMQIYGTVYFPYISGKVGFLGIGYNWGASRYNFDLHEGDRRVARTTRKWRPVESIAVIIGLNLNRYVGEGILRDSHLFLEANIEDSPRHAIHVPITEGNRLNTSVLRANGTNPPPLYVSQVFLRIGVRKAVSLIEPAGDEPKSDS